MTCLEKFGVPVLDENSQSGIIQPKQKYRFRVITINFGPQSGQEELTRAVEGVTRPTLQHETVPVHSYNSTAYYAGKHTWNSITLDLRDDISNRASRLVAAQLQKQINHFEQRGVPAGINYKFEMFIEMLDGQTVNPLERWRLCGCFLANVNYDQLNYSDSQYLKMQLEVRYDNAVNNVMEEFGSIGQSNAILSEPFTSPISRERL